MKPYLLALPVSGILIGLALIFIYLNRNSEELTGIKLVNLLLFLSTAISIHGILHILVNNNSIYNI